MSNPAHLPSNFVAISLETLNNFLMDKNAYKECLLENKKLKYQLQKKNRKKPKIISHPPSAPLETSDENLILKQAKKLKKLPKQKPVIKREKITCGICNHKVSKSHLKRHQNTKKCKTQSVQEVEVEAIVAEVGEETLVLNQSSDEELAYE